MLFDYFDPSCWYNTNDDMSCCSYVGPNPAHARRKSTSSSGASPSTAGASGVTASSGSLASPSAHGSGLDSTFRSDGGGDVIIPSSTLDRTAQSAVQRIAMVRARRCLPHGRWTLNPKP